MKRVTQAHVVEALERVQRDLNDLRAQTELIAKLLMGSPVPNLPLLAAELEEPEESQKVKGTLERLHEVWGDGWQPPVEGNS